MVDDVEMLNVSFCLWTFRAADGSRFVTDIPCGVVRDVSKRHECVADLIEDLSSMVGYGGLYDVFLRVPSDDREAVRNTIVEHFSICGATVSAQWG